MKVNNKISVNFSDNKYGNTSLFVPRELKTADKSSLEALAVQGRAQLNINKTSFKGAASAAGTEMSDEEFEEMKKILDKKLKSLPENMQQELSGLLNFAGINKNNIYVFIKIFSNENLYSNIRNIPMAIFRCETMEQQKTAYKILSDENLLHLNNISSIIENFSNSAFNNPEEYLNACQYFANLKDSNGERIMDGKVSENLYPMQEKQILSYLTSINPSSVSASTLEMLIQLVQDGIAGKHIFGYLPKKGTINPLVEADIDKFYEAYSLKINPDEMFVPEFENEKSALKAGDALKEGSYKAVKTGDVFHVKGEKHIRIRTGEKTSELLNISKKTYLKLFPPIERFASTQNNIGNCWQISGINSLLLNPKTRIYILKLFNENGDDIAVKFPASKLNEKDVPSFELKFKNMELPQNLDKQYYSQGALGVQMLEYSGKKLMEYNALEKVKEFFNCRIINSANEKEKEALKKQLNEMEKAAKINENIIFNLNENNNIDYELSDIRRLGNSSAELYYECGCIDVKELVFSDINMKKQAKELLSNPQFFEDYAVTWASAGENSDGVINDELGIVPHHGYTITPGKINNHGKIETFKLINTFGVLETELTYEQIFQYGQGIMAAK